MVVHAGEDSTKSARSSACRDRPRTGRRCTRVRANANPRTARSSAARDRLWRTRSSCARRHSSAPRIVTATALGRLRGSARCAWPARVRRVRGRVHDQAVQRGGQPPIGAREMPQLVREHGREMIAFQQGPREHQGVPAHRGIRLRIVEHEPENQRVKRDCMTNHSLCLGFRTGGSLPPSPTNHPQTGQPLHKFFRRAERACAAPERALGIEARTWDGGSGAPILDRRPATRGTCLANDQRDGVGSVIRRMLVAATPVFSRTRAKRSCSALTGWGRALAAHTSSPLAAQRDEAYRTASLITAAL